METNLQKEPGYSQGGRFVYGDCRIGCLSGIDAGQSFAGIERIDNAGRAATTIPSSAFGKPQNKSNHIQ